MDSAKGTFCILASTGEFWTGSSWAQEYPEALTFQTFHGASLEAKRYQLLKVCHVVQDYGLDSERVRATFPDGEGVTRG